MMNNWESLGTVPYRKFHVYDMAWTTDGGKPFPLEDYIICGAPFGGPIAMYLDPKRMKDSTPRWTTTLLMYSSSGRKISETEWEGRSIVSMGWSDHELLMIISDGGNYAARRPTLQCFDDSVCVCM